MNKKIFWLIPVVLVLAVAMLFITSVSSQIEPDWTPPGNISLHDYYCILNPACIVGDILMNGYDIYAGCFYGECVNVSGNVTGSWCKCKVNWSDVQNTPPAFNASNFMNLTELANIYLNLSGTNANQNIDISPYNLTASWFFGNINASYVQNDPWIEDSQESSLNVNSSTWWGIYQFASDLNYQILSYWANITGRPTHLSNFTDDLGDRGYTHLSNFTDDTDYSTKNVNSSTWWAGVSGWVSGWFKQTGNDLDFNETKLNETIDARFPAVYLNLSGTNANQNINISPYNFTASWFFGNLNWSDVQNAPSGITDTNASTACSGTTTYLDGEGNCDDISGVYVNVAGDNVTGNINMTNNSVVGLYQVNFTDGGYIRDNGTAIVIGHL